MKNNRVCHTEKFLFSISALCKRLRCRVETSRHDDIIYAGFTLIELLVVVLIIGILAAAALPQYEKAVEKSRVAEAKIILKQIANAQDAYILTNGEATSNFGELDIQIPETNNWEFYLEETMEPGTYALSASRNNKNYVIHYTRGYGDDDGYFLCAPYTREGAGECYYFGGASSMYRMPASGWYVMRI